MDDVWIPFNMGELCIPRAALMECHHQGRCDDDLEHWEQRIDWSKGMSADKIRDELSEYGAWDSDGLSNDKHNRQRILWIAAGNWQEEQPEGELCLSITQG